MQATLTVPLLSLSLVGLQLLFLPPTLFLFQTVNRLWRQFHYVAQDGLELPTQPQLALNYGSPA